MLEPATGPRVTPSDYEAMFRKKVEAPAFVTGICGRVIRGRAEEDFTRLVFQEERRLAWVVGPIGLRRMIDLRPIEIVLGIGKHRNWLDEKLAEGFSWRLVVFPDVECRPATWDGLFEMVALHYPAEVLERLQRWRSRLQDADQPLPVPARYTTSQVKDDVRHPLHMSVDRYLESPDTRENARLFLWHSIGVNDLFTGTGTSPETGFDEYLARACTLSDLPGHVSIELNVA